MYFRGVNNTIAQLDFVEKLMPASQTDTYVVNGCSAGGIAVFLWADKIRDILLSKNPAIKVLASANAGFLFDYPQVSTGVNYYGSQMKVVASLANYGKVPFPNDKCTKLYGETNPHYCLMPEHLMHLIETPL